MPARYGAFPWIIIIYKRRLDDLRPMTDDVVPITLEELLSRIQKAQRLHELMIIGTDLRVWEEHESPYKQIALALKDMGIRSGNIGMEERLRFFIFDGIRKEAAHLNYVSGDPVTIPCRDMLRTSAGPSFLELRPPGGKGRYGTLRKEPRQQALRRPGCRRPVRMWILRPGKY